MLRCGKGLFAAILGVALLCAAPRTRAADGIAALLQQTRWGESEAELLRQFGAAARRIRPPLDFGDSRAGIVLPGLTLGGVPMVGFLQIDKATGGLKRIQLERPPHGINPPAFRALAAALAAELGRPEAICAVPPLPASGWQAAVEESWQLGTTRVSAIFRDTTLQAFEGCLFGPAAGWCGLRGSLLVRLEPGGSAAGCLRDRG